MNDAQWASKERIQGHRPCLDQGKFFVMFGAGTCLGGEWVAFTWVFKFLPALRLHAPRDLSLAGQTWAEDRGAFLFSVGSTGWRGLGTDQCFDRSLVLLVLAAGLEAALRSLSRTSSRFCLCRSSSTSPEQALLPLCLCNDFPGSHSAYYRSHNKQSWAS